MARKGLGLCLSGGGNRALLFHLGALTRLNELGVLSRLDAISSVSGGSVLAGILATRWRKLTAKNGVFTNFDAEIVNTAKNFVADDIRSAALIYGRLKPRNFANLFRDDYSATDLLAEEFDRRLFNGFMLGDLPDAPRFIFCASNMETGVCWKFSKTETGDYMAGTMKSVRLPLARVVAASAAFTLAFPPLHFRFDAQAFEGGQLAKDAHPELAKFRETVLLTDGGVYDNLGLEPLWKSFETVLVSDGGRPMSLDIDPDDDVKTRLMRAYDISSNQARALRTRMLVDDFKRGDGLKGTFWGIGTKVGNYPDKPNGGYAGQELALISSVRTDFNAFTSGERAILINHGYALADAAIRSHTKGLAGDPLPAFQWPGTNRPGDAANPGVLARSHERTFLNLISI